ncbi:MAG: hypothetical protein H7A51_08415 [Akkermansiaceae bacterium]|nr:hypothetical protein [Akkermansiaceae bacterium]
MNTGARVFCVLLSAGLGILVFPPIGWSTMAVLAWAPLLFALGGVKPPQALYLGLVHGALFYGVTMSWLLDVFQESRYVFIPLVLIMALFTGFFARGYAVASIRYRMGWTTALFAAVWWVAVEFYRSEVFHLKFPWMTPGVGLDPTWMSPILGVYGVSFLIILGAAMVCQRRLHRLLGSVILLVMVVSVMLQKTRESPMNTSVTVAAVQSEVADIDHYIQLTRSVTSEDTKSFDIILWPEYALPLDVRRNHRQWRQLNDLAEETSSILVVGTQTSTADGWYNTALTFSRDGVLGEHYKNHTVHFFEDGIAGKEANAVAAPRWKIGTPICFDCDYQDVIRRMVADGAEFLIIPSMDAIHWGEKQHDQHAELFRHRAAENGRWAVVAATSGMTQVIDPNGNRVQSIPMIEEGVLTTEIAKSNRQTIYTRAGWLFPWLCLVGGVGWVLWLGVQGILEKRQSRDTRIA